MASENRSDHFQPEKPHSPAKSSNSGRTTLFVVAAVAAAMVVMILALAAPRFLGDGGLRWLLTLGFGALAFAVIVGVGLLRGSSS